MEAAQTSWRSLGELFVERGLISEADLERALAEQVATKRRLADILVRRGLVTGHDITNALMEQLGNRAPLQTPVAVPAEPAAAPALTAVPDAAPPQVAEVVALPEPRLPAAEKTEPEQPQPEHPAATEAASKPAPVASTPAVAELSVSAPALIAEAESRRRGAETELGAAREAHTHLLRGLEQVRAELEARDFPTDGLIRELEQIQIRLQEREEELASEVATWEEARREAERHGGRLGELRVRLEEREHELSEATAAAAVWSARAAELEAEAEALAGRVDGALQALEDLADTRFAATGVTLSAGPVPDDGRDRTHADSARALYFVPKAEGYDLVERDGEVPTVGESLEHGGRRFVVTKIGRSPLPFDRRNCVFLSAI